ncbi:MAG: hypothetical protein GX852_01215 [Clostridiales bacterium]|jgi:hypothetical protein|nr:hypothetical protein [Clostridiales bacterium]
MRFDKDERPLIYKVGMDPDKISNDNDYVLLEEKIGDYLVMNCLDEKYKPNKEGLACKSILGKLA